MTRVPAITTDACAFNALASPSASAAVVRRVLIAFFMVTTGDQEEN
jgi:hypothetical protein